MAQLKDTVVQGSLRVTDTTYTNILSITGTTDASSTSTGALIVAGGAGIAKKLYVGGDTNLAGHLYFEASKQLYMNYNNTDWCILRTFNNGNIGLQAAGSGLYLGYDNTTSMHLYYSSGTARTEYLTINNNGAYAQTRFGVNGQSTSANLYVNGTGWITNTLTGVTLQTINTTTNGAQIRFLFSDKSDSTYGLMWATRTANKGGRLYFAEYSENSSGTRLNYREQYRLPEPNADLTSSPTYDILTTKDMSFSITGNAATATLPLGFSSRGTNATWGNQTGTTITTWNDSSGGSIDFRKDNPSSGKTSIKIDGRFYGNEGTYPAMLMSDPNSTGYWGMGNPDGANNVWIRTTSSGIIPYQSGAAGSGHGQLGTSSWYFSTAYIDNIYGNLNGNATALNLAGSNRASTTTDTYPKGALTVDWFSATGKLPGQPSQYGFLLTVATGASAKENHQIYITQTNGSLYHRGTNADSYASPPAFKTILDSGNYTDYTVTKTGSGASGSWGISITGNAATATKLAHTTLDNTTINNTAGSFAFSGSGDPWSGTDWVGLQIGDSVDKFQIVAGNNTLQFRQNDNGGTNTTWSNWVTMLTSANYTDYTVTKTGTGASGSWGISVTGSSASCTGNAASATYLQDRTNSTASYLNYGAAGLAASAITWLCCWNGYEVRAISKAEMRNAVSSPYMVTETYPALVPTNASNNWIKVGTANTSYGLLPSQAGNVGSGHNYLGTSSWYWKYAYIDEIYSVHTRGAVWNDYAEYRKAYKYEPGYAIAPSGEYTKSRLESGARIISDTYGFAIGYMENRKDMAPVAIAGRVLAYPYKDKSKYKIGNVVCSAPGGAVDVMTREEIMMYPDCIIGIVNEIPDYDIWEPSLIGEDSKPVHTNGRIWIDIK